MLELRRVTDQVFNRRNADRIASGVAEARNRASQVAGEVAERGNEMAQVAYRRGSEAARVAYDYAMNHRKATGAVVLGAGIAAAVIWMLNRNGGYNAMRKKAQERVRRTTAKSRRKAAS
jgi:hypothetical protein